MGIVEPDRMEDLPFRRMRGTDADQASRLTVGSIRLVDAMHTPWFGAARPVALSVTAGDELIHPE